jgi:hypothetical protein
MITREQRILGIAVSGAINVLNASYGKGPDAAAEEVNVDPDHTSNIAEVIANLSSRMQVESAIAVLNAALNRFD